MEIVDNNFLRQFETKVGSGLAIIEYSVQDRKIFLTIRNERGKLKTIRQLKDLIAHELTHTALNHVRWREDDHDEKFTYYNKLILS